MLDQYTRKHTCAYQPKIKPMNRRIIQEWDGSTNVIRPSRAPSAIVCQPGITTIVEMVTITYEDGLRHVVPKAYLDSITIRTFAD